MAEGEGEMKVDVPDPEGLHGIYFDKTFNAKCSLFFILALNNDNNTFLNTIDLYCHFKMLLSIIGIIAD